MQNPDNNFITLPLQTLQKQAHIIPFAQALLDKYPSSLSKEMLKTFLQKELLHASITDNVSMHWLMSSLTGLRNAALVAIRL